MDSGNSGGSLQSSSGAEEEYDSSFMNNTNTRRRTNNPPLSNPSQITNFETLSNYFDSISSRPQPPPLLDMSSWSKTLRSDPNTNSSPADHISPAVISSPPSSLSSFFGSFSVTTTTPPPPISAFSTILSGIETNSTPIIAASNASNISSSATNTPRPTSDHSNPTRNPKKRSRASRRAPTTVLTTDTTNFRAMVQEFTGIPAPPFTSSSPFCRAARLDLYGTNPYSMRSNPLLDFSQLPPSYLRRPFPQKVPLPPPPPFIASSSSAVTAAPSSSSSPLLNSDGVVSLDETNNNIVSTSAAINFQLPHQSSNLFNNLPNNHPIVASMLFQSKFPDLNPPPNIGGLEIPSKESQLRVVGGVLDDQFGHVYTGSLSGLPGLISSDQTTARNNNSSNGNDNWDGSGSLSLARMNAATNGKMGYSSSGTNSSNFHGDKASDSVAVAAASSRGEGIMEYVLQTKK